jgi:hypothetical protein
VQVVELGAFGVEHDDPVAFVDRQPVRGELQPIRLGENIEARGGDAERRSERPRKSEAARDEDGADDQERGDAVLDDPTPLTRCVVLEGYGPIAARSIV